MKRKTIRKYVGGEEEKKTFLSVIGNKFGDVANSASNVALKMLNLKRIDDVPEIKKVDDIAPEPNKAVEAISNLTGNLTDGFNDAVKQTLDLTDKLNDPQTVERLEQGLNNVGKVLDPIVNKVADKVGDVIEKESPKVAAAFTDAGVAVANGIPGVGAAVSLGKELNDVNAIVASGLESYKEISETVNEGLVEGVKKYEEIKNLQTDTTNAAMDLANSLPTTQNVLKGGGRNFKMLQSAGATISNRIKNTINDFLKNKTYKNKKKVRFNV